MTVVAVVHGYDDGEGARAEIYPYDTAEVVGGRGAELMASWRPQPGELDDSAAVQARMTGLRGGSEPARTIGERPRAAQGFVDTFRESDLALARRVAGSQGHSPVYDETYTYEIGEVMLFDAEVDPQNMLVDWSTAREHVLAAPGVGTPTLEPVVQDAPEPAGAAPEQSSVARRMQIPPALAMGVTPLVVAGTRVGGKAAQLAREKGPAVMSAARTKLADPEVQAQLRTVASTAIEVGLASKGGRSAQVASKAATAMRVGDSVLAGRRSVASPGAGRAALSPTAAAVLGSAAAKTVSPAGARPRPQPGF